MALAFKMVSWDDIVNNDYVLVQRKWLEKLGPNGKDYSMTFYKVTKRNPKSAWLYEVDAFGKNLGYGAERWPRSKIPRTIVDYVGGGAGGAD